MFESDNSRAVLSTGLIRTGAAANEFARAADEAAASRTSTGTMWLMVCHKPISRQP